MRGFKQCAIGWWIIEKCRYDQTNNIWFWFKTNLWFPTKKWIDRARPITIWPGNMARMCCRASLFYDTRVFNKVDECYLLATGSKLQGSGSSGHLIGNPVGIITIQTHHLTEGSRSKTAAAINYTIATEHYFFHRHFWGSLPMPEGRRALCKSYFQSWDNNSRFPLLSQCGP